MDIKQLSYFISAAEHQNFTRAARDCFIVQTAMTHQIASLERELGVKLFERSNRSVTLTPAGEVFLVQARRIVQSAEEAIMLARSTAEGAKRILRIGCCGRLLHRELPGALVEFTKHDPEVRITLKSGGLGQMLTQLEQGLVDCVLSLDYPYLKLLDWVDMQVIATDRLMVAMCRDHPLAGREALTASDLAEEPYILYRERGAKELMEDYNRDGTPLRIAAELEDAESTEIMVEAGFGVSFVLRHLCKWDDPAVAYVPMEGDKSQNDLVLCSSVHRTNADVEHFAQVLRESVPEEMRAKI